MWQPDEQGLLQIVELLGQSLKANQGVQTEIYQVCKTIYNKIRALLTKIFFSK